MKHTKSLHTKWRLWSESLLNCRNRYVFSHLSCIWIMTVISSSCIGLHFQKAEMTLRIGIAMVANCNVLGLQYLLWWVQGCLFWPLQSLRKLASLMFLHLGAGSLFSISRLRFWIACTLGILSRLLAWSPFSASQTKFWWPFRFFCLAIMLLCTLSQISFIAVFTAFECDIGSWASSASTENSSLPRNNPFGHSGENWALPPAENLQLFVLFIEENDDPWADSHMARVNPTATTSTHQRGMDGGWTRETLVRLRSSYLSNLIWTQLQVHRWTPTEWWEAFDGWCAGGGCWLSHSCHIRKLNL